MPKARLPIDDLALVCSSAESPLRRLDGGHVLITGASGLIGSWMLETLLDARRALGIDVSATALVRDRAAFERRLPHLAASPHLSTIEGDVRSFAVVGRTPTHVIHAASAATPDENAKSPADVIDVIESGTAHVLDVAERAGVSRLLLLSSGSVYAQQSRPVTEDDPAVTRGETVSERFGAAKRRAEDAASARGDGLGVTIARVFTLFGPRLPIGGQFAVGQFLGDAMEHRDVHVRGDGTPLRSYLYLADLASWCWHLLDRGGSPRAYNVGARTAIPVGEIARQVADLAGVAVRFGSRPVTGAPPSCYLPDVARAHRDLKLDESTSIDTRLTRTWA